MSALPKPVSAFLHDDQTLPGEARLDESLVSEAVSEINRIYLTRGLETALQLGEYLLETFFHDDFRQFHRFGPHHVSFRALAQRDDLLVSHSTLYTAIAVYEQISLLPSDAARSLPLSHHKALLVVKNPKRKIALARMAYEEGLTSREFREEIRRTQPRRGNNAAKQVGRPPLPQFVKALRRLDRITNLATSHSVDPRDFERYDERQALELVEEVERNLKRLENLLDDVRRVLGEVSRPA